MKPYYDRLDRLVGIFGSAEGLPNEPDGIFMPPPKPRCYELLIKQAADKLGITCIADRLSILTQPLNGRAGLPLLRPVRPRLRDALELLVAVGAAPAGAGDRAADDHHQRDGARGHGRRHGPGERRRLHRQEHAPGQSRARAHRRARGQRVRVRAHPAELEVVEVPAGPGELERHRRQVSDGHDRRRRLAGSSRR